MIKDCIICGQAVNVPEETEIVTCESEHCQMVVENSIGIHYTPAQPENNLVYENGKLVYGH